MLAFIDLSCEVNEMFKDSLTLFTVGIFFCSGCLASPDLPLLVRSQESGRYVPIPEKEWNSKVNEGEYVFSQLSDDELLEVNDLYKEMRIEYLYGEFRGDSSAELGEFLERLIDASTPRSISGANSD